MQCKFCNYDGPRKEFDRDKTLVYASPSGMGKIRPCPACGRENYFSRPDELDEDEKELKALCMEMDEAIRAGDINVTRLRRQMKEMSDLNRFLNFEWVDKFFAYINGKLMGR